jgi:tRNA U34 5-methylaminomethyl-2-thiouridine-forming methyltransferase MnmC
MPVEIIITSDGSHSLFDPVLDETYHSIHGAVQESGHVFIGHGLRFFVDQNPGKHVRIFEVGFGTGLNALLALKFAEETLTKVSFTTIEAFPISLELALAMNYPAEVEKKAHEGTKAGRFPYENLYRQIHQSEWSEWQKISKYFELLKREVKLEDLEFVAGEENRQRRTPVAGMTPEAKFDVVFFDAFAPSKQPEMWTNDMLRKVVERMDDGGVFVTYCAKGQVKRDLASLGLKVETLPGPPGKKEMTRGLKRA